MLLRFIVVGMFFCVVGCNVLDIHFTFVRDGRPSGEAYVELACEGDVQAALQKNQQHMGKRYIEGSNSCGNSLISFQCDLSENCFFS